MKGQTIDLFYLIALIILALALAACAFYAGWLGAAGMGGV